MNSRSEYPGDFASRKQAFQEGMRQYAIAQGLVESGLVPAVTSVRFVTVAERTAIMDRARDSGLQTAWRRRSSWEEIAPDLTSWLEGQECVVSGLTRVVASGAWYAERIEKLRLLWRDLYLYAPDGLSGYMLNEDSELGLETICWDRPVKAGPEG
jgi:hypothetical protein